MSSKADLYNGNSDNIRIYTETNEIVSSFLSGYSNKCYLVIDLGKFKAKYVDGFLIIKTGIPDIPIVKILGHDIIDFEIDNDYLSVSFSANSITGKSFKQGQWIVH